ncbi:MAG: TIGR04552 family protein [Deltaproteobacteria bacterium]
MSVPQGLKRLEALALVDVEALRLILLGSSVIDWRRLAFSRRDEVDNFLRLCRFDPDSPSDQDWMRGVLRDAVTYLRETFRYRVAPQVAEPPEIHDLFLYASGAREPQFRKIACIILKVCHVIYHIEGRDLFHRLPLAEEAFGEMAEVRVMAVFHEMRLAGFPIQEVRSSAKSRASLISKLLQKAETLAAKIYDRTRFRVVVVDRDDVLPVLQGLSQRLFPFHLVVPGQSENSLIDFREVCATTPAWAPLLGSLQFGVDFSNGPGRQDVPEGTGRNEVSGETYRMLKFVVDMPLRIDERLISPEIAAATRARTVCCLVEIQVVDAATASQNEQGENDHERYKRRQRQRVLRRLSRGLVTPRVRKETGGTGS